MVIYLPVLSIIHTFRYKCLTNRHDTRRDIQKIITFSKHLKSENNEVVVSGIVPRGDSYKQKAEVVSK